MHFCSLICPLFPFLRGHVLSHLRKHSAGSIHLVLFSNSKHECVIIWLRNINCKSKDNEFFHSFTIMNSQFMANHFLTFRGNKHCILKKPPQAASAPARTNASLTEHQEILFANTIERHTTNTLNL